MPVNMPGYRHLNIAQEGLSGIADAALSYIEKERQRKQMEQSYQQLNDFFTKPQPAQPIQTPKQPESQQTAQGVQAPSQLNPIQDVPQAVPAMSDTQRLLQMMQTNKVDPMQAFQAVQGMQQPKYQEVPYGGKLLRIYPDGKREIVAENPHVAPTPKPGTQWHMKMNPDGSPATIKLQGTTYTLKEDDQGNVLPDKPGRPVTVPGSGMNMTQDDVKAVAQGIKEGSQPPTLEDMYRNGGPVRAELQKMGVNFQQMQTEWKGVQKHMSSLNSTQQLRLRQSVGTAAHMILVVRQAYQELVNTKLPTGFPLWNKAAIAAAVNVPGETGVKARALQQLLNDFIPELSQVYMGGNTPTDHALKLAEGNLQSNWTPQQFDAALKNLEKILSVRQNAISFTGPNGVPLQSRYMEGINTNADQSGAFNVQPGGAQGTGLKPGAVEDGYRFKGGDPADQSNWEKVP